MVNQSSHTLQGTSEIAKDCKKNYSIFREKITIFFLECFEARVFP